MANGNNTDSKAAVYVAWATFKNYIVDGHVEGGLPPRIDKSIFVGQSGGVQAQLMAGLRFLNLIDDAGVPTKALHDLTDSEEGARKAAMASILQARYQELFALGLDRATAGQFRETIEKAYNVTGDTKEKAIRFFLGAAEWAGVPLSKYLTGTVSKGTASRKKTTKPQRAATSAASPAADEGEQGDTGTPPPPGMKRMEVPEDFVIFKCKITGGQFIDIALPPSLTTADVTRLNAFLLTQVDDEDGE